MKVKKIYAIMMALVLMVSAFSIPASAAGYAIENMSARIYGGARVSSQSAQKNNTNYEFYYNASPKTSDGWSTAGNEWVYFRGRNADGSQRATELDHRNYTGRLVEGYLLYEAGHGVVGAYYKMAIEYDNNNPYEYVNLSVGWAP